MSNASTSLSMSCQNSEAAAAQQIPQLVCQLELGVRPRASVLWVCMCVCDSICIWGSNQRMFWAVVVVAAPCWPPPPPVSLLLSLFLNPAFSPFLALPFGLCLTTSAKKRAILNEHINSLQGKTKTQNQSHKAQVSPNPATHTPNTPKTHTCNTHKQTNNKKFLHRRNTKDFGHKLGLLALPSPAPAQMHRW